MPQFYRTEPYVPQPINPLESVGQALGVRHMLNRQREEERAIQERDALRQLAMETGGDLDQMVKLGAQKGISPDTLVKLQGVATERAAKLRAAKKDELEMWDKQNEIAGTTALALLDVPPEQRSQFWQTLRPQLSKHLPPEMLPEELPDEGTLKFIAATSAKTREELRKAAAEKRAEETHAEELRGKRAESDLKVSEAAAAKEFGGLNPQMADAKYRFLQQRLAMGQPVKPEDQAFLKAYEKQKTIVTEKAASLRPVININSGADGGFSQAALDQAAQLYATTGQMPALGFGKAGAQLRIAIANRAAELYPGADLASNKAGFASGQATLTQVMKMKNAVEAYEKTASRNLDIFLSAAKQIPDTGVPWLNQPLRSVSVGALGSKDVAAFNAARQVALTEISRVVNNPNLTGVLSDSAREEIMSLNPANATFSQIKRVVEVLKQDMKNRHDSLVEQERSLREQLKGAQGGAAGPKVGDKKTFPNGSVGVWDGQGWVKQ